MTWTTHLVSMADLRAYDITYTPPNSPMELMGFYAAQDGGGGNFVWDPDNSSDDDGGTIIQPTAVGGSGRWLRLYSGPLNVRWFGAKGDGVAADDPAIQAAIDVGQGTTPVYIPPGYYMITATLLLYQHQVINGEGVLQGNIADYPRISGNAPYYDWITGEDCYSIVSVTASGTTITAETGTAHDFSTGDTVATGFMLPDEYCGIQTIMVIDSTHFSYTVPTAPATSPGTCYGARAAKMTYPTIPDALDWADQTGGACFGPQVSSSGIWTITGITLANFRYGALVYTVNDSGAYGGGNNVFRNVTFDSCNVAVYGYPASEGTSLIGCQFAFTNSAFCADAVCMVDGHPGIGSGYCDNTIVSDAEETYPMYFAVNFNFDIWFYESVLRPATACGDAYATPCWYPYARGENKIPPSESAISGHAVFMPNRIPRPQAFPTISTLTLENSVRSGVLIANPAGGSIDHVSNEVYTGVMPTEPMIQILAGLTVSAGTTIKISRVQPLLDSPITPTLVVELPYYYDDTNTVVEQGDPGWLNGLPPAVLTDDCTEPNQAPKKLRPFFKSAVYSSQLVDTFASDDPPVAYVIGDSFSQPTTAGFNEQGIRRFSNSFLLGDPSTSMTNAVQIRVGGYARAYWFYVEFFVIRLDTGATDYSKALCGSFTSWGDFSNAGTTGTDLNIGDTSVAASITYPPYFLNPGMVVTVGDNNLVIRSYDGTTVTFYTAATAFAASGSTIAVNPSFAVIQDFSNGIFNTLDSGGNNLWLQTPLYSYGDPPIPIAVTYWITEALFFDGGPIQ